MKYALSILLLIVSMPRPTAADATFPADEWASARPHEFSIDPARLADAITFLETNVGKDGVRQLVIIRSGRLIHQGPDANKVHGVWSVTKCFTSTVLGLLIDDGKVTLDTPAKNFAPELAERFPAITLRHFATMTSGYRAVGDEPRGSYTHGPSPTWSEPGQPLFAPGEKYAYWDSAMNEFGLVLTRAAGEPIESLFKRRVADVIGMKTFDWGDFGKRRGDLVVNGGSGNSNKHVQLSALDLARFGHLYLNKGKWAGKQLLSETYVAEATKVQVRASLPLGHKESNIDGRGVYGLNWWVNGITPDGKRLWPHAPPGTFAASGHNNNKCFVIPEWNMVVVRMGLDGNVKDEVWDGFFERLCDAIADKQRRAEAPQWPLEVVRVEGIVQTRTSPEQPWSRAAVGTRLPESMELRTFAGGTVLLRGADGKEYEANRLGMFRGSEIARVARPRQAEASWNWMRYGRVTYDIEGEGVEHETTIRVPATTLHDRVRRSPTTQPAWTWRWGFVGTTPTVTIRPSPQPTTQPVLDK